MNFDYENSLKRTKGCRVVAGVDEVGRGPLAGPVFASAFVFLKPIPVKAQRVINDSKLLSVQHREQCFDWFVEWKEQGVVDFTISYVRATTIDSHNIQHATVIAMQRCVKKLQPTPQYVVVDNIAYQKYTRKLFSVPYEVQKKADTRIISVAAASIVSKVTRDRLMSKYHSQYPLYGFNSHKGYGTKQHYAAIANARRNTAPQKEFPLVLVGIIQCNIKVIHKGGIAFFDNILYYKNNNKIIN